jgi:metal-dependent hydrolase (beta-lactamase superfamily II)
MSKSIYLPVLLLISLTSCKAILTKIVINRSIVKNAHYLQKGDQKVIFLSMIHINKRKNFEEVKEFIIEKRKLGYKVYYEKVSYDKDATDFEEASLKMRKLTGLTFGQNYLSEEQKEIRENINEKKYTWQSKVDYGVDFEKDIHSDYTLSSLVKAYEEKNGEVILDSCDYNTPLDIKYKCASLNKYLEVVHHLRDAKLVRHILDTIQKKKLIVFGLGHYYSSSGVFINLYHDQQYSEVKAKNWID